MTGWRWSFLCHVIVWIVLAILALRVAAVANMATLAVVTALLLPVMRFLPVVIPREQLEAAFTLYYGAWIIGIATWLVSGISRSITGRPTTLRMFGHFVIALLGLIGVVAAAQVNFPLREFKESGIAEEIP